MPAPPVACSENGPTSIVTSKASSNAPLRIATSTEPVPVASPTNSTLASTWSLKPEAIWYDGPLLDDGLAGSKPWNVRVNDAVLSSIVALPLI